MRWARRVFSHYAFIGISRRHLRLLVAELRPGWLAGREGRLHSRRGRARRRAAGAGRRAMLRFTDRLVVTLVQLRLGMPHEAIAVASGWTGPRSPGRSVSCGRCRPHAAAPLLPVYDHAPWPMYSPAPPPRASHCVWTPPRSGSAAHGLAGLGAKRSCPANSNRTRSRPPSRPTSTEPCCGAAVPGPDACLTPPPPASRASMRCWRSIPDVKLLVDAGTCSSPSSVPGISASFGVQLCPVRQLNNVATRGAGLACRGSRHRAFVP